MPDKYVHVNAVHHKFCLTRCKFYRFTGTNFQDFSRTQIEFYWMLNFSSQDFNVNSPYCLPYISYFLLSFSRFLELSRTSSLFPGLSSSGIFPGFAGPAAWTLLTIISHVAWFDQLKSRSTQRCEDKRAKFRNAENFIDRHQCLHKLAIF